LASFPQTHKAAFFLLTLLNTLSENCILIRLPQEPGLRDPAQEE
jgi:hypothetical protein